MAKESRDNESTALAVLSSFGVTKPWHPPLLLPTSYDDFTQPLTDLRQVEPGVPCAVHVHAVDAPTRAGRGIPRVTFQVADATGERWRVTLFGDDPALGEGILPGAELLMIVVGKEWRGELGLTCKENVDLNWLGKVRPLYPGRGADRERTRAIVRTFLPDNVQHAAAYVARHLEPIAQVQQLLAAVGCEGWSLEDVIWQTHEPKSLAYALHACRAYLELAALGAIQRSQSGHDPQPAAPLLLRTLGRRAAAFPGQFTDDQRAAVKGIAEELARPVAMRAVLAADVGTGKSWVAELLAATAADAGGRTLIMAPTYPLAVQLAEEFQRIFPDIACVLVADGHGDSAAAAATVVVGTSAVLTRSLGEFALVVVDEQQRWSRAQREHYVTTRTHLLEMSATCIPRTQALIRFGKVVVFQMRQTHAKKEIHTHLWEGSGGPMFAYVKEAIDAGRPIMVVYPKRESEDDSAKKKKGKGKAAGQIDDRHSIEEAFPRWDAMYPGRVRAMTGEDDNEAKRAGIDDLKEGRAQILLTTTVVEVGISVPNLYDIVVVHPDRYGITTLHQLRGRVARNGGVGHCHLWCPEPMSAKTRERLEVVVSTTDGFELAEADLRIRGTGDLGADSATQSGADETLLFGAPLTVELIEDVTAIWDHFVSSPGGGTTGARKRAP
ncbi:DEAD/DEAH box helicase [Rhodanobacter denitrificans]|uniref:DEAD/DEAH box helicase n=1 Tax=Rhodanobacter denitrificans TaxID=666685 RepID=UPI001F2F720C|nr:DEAD/DEAH box helicase [Rhodanobacter denitrificans]UJJ60415.1 DEAD/DEAH box helicase [Rhodanobacter denitrificans]